LFSIASPALRLFVRLIQPDEKRTRPANGRGQTQNLLAQIPISLDPDLGSRQLSIDALRD
jgi:hypothetical protein